MSLCLCNRYYSPLQRSAIEQVLAMFLNGFVVITCFPCTLICWAAEKARSTSITLCVQNTSTRHSFADSFSNSTQPWVHDMSTKRYTSTENVLSSRRYSSTVKCTRVQCEYHNRKYIWKRVRAQRWPTRIHDVRLRVVQYISSDLLCF